MKLLVTTLALGFLAACQEPPSAGYAREAPRLGMQERQQIGGPIGVTVAQPAPEDLGANLTVDVVIADALARHPHSMPRWRAGARRRRGWTS